MTRRITMTRGLLPCVLLALGLCSFAGASQAERYLGTVAKNVDGDTINFQKEGSEGASKPWKIRMLGIDAPELHLPVKDGPPVGQSPWGEKAAEYLQNRVPVGTRVTVASFGLDHYRRVLGDIELGGVDINLEMVKTGWAIPYVICDNGSCDEKFFETYRVREYLSACDEARENGRGIFNPKNPLTEMPFEFRLRMQERAPDKYVGDFDTHKLYAPAQYKSVDVCRRIFFFSRESATRLGFESNH